jgi:hypothetical protein
MFARKAFLVSLMAASIAITCVSNVRAETRWEKNHPRRDQVNDRLAHQDARIHEEVKEGDLTHKQAASLHAQDHAIRTEERAMASQHNGHITKRDQKVLNKQENAVSKEIGH